MKEKIISLLKNKQIIIIGIVAIALISLFSYVIITATDDGFSEEEWAEIQEKNEREYEQYLLEHGENIENTYDKKAFVANFVVPKNEYKNPCPCPKHAKELLRDNDNYSSWVNNMTDEELMLYAYGENSEEYILWHLAAKYKSTNPNAEEFPSEQIDDVLNRWCKTIEPINEEADHDNLDEKYFLDKYTFNGLVFSYNIVDDLPRHYHIDFSQAYEGYRQVIDEFEKYLKDYNFTSSYNVRLGNFYHDVKSYYDLLMSGLYEAYDANGNLIKKGSEVNNPVFTSLFYSKNKTKDVIHNFLSEEFITEFNEKEAKGYMDELSEVYYGDTDNAYRLHAFGYYYNSHLVPFESEEQKKEYLNTLRWNVAEFNDDYYLVKHGESKDNFINSFDVNYYYGPLITRDSEEFKDYEYLNPDAKAFRRVVRYEVIKDGHVDVDFANSDKGYYPFDLVEDHGEVCASYVIWSYGYDDKFKQVKRGNEIIANYDLINNWDDYEDAYYEEFSSTPYSVCEITKSLHYCSQHIENHEMTKQDWADYIGVDVSHIHDEGEE